MADERAMEIQASRENPLDGRGAYGGAYLKDGRVVSVPYGRLGATRFALPPMELPIADDVPLGSGGARRRAPRRKPAPAAAVEEKSSVFARVIKILHDAGLYDLVAKAALNFLKKRSPMLKEHLEGSGFFDKLKGVLGRIVKPALSIASVLPGPAGIVGKVGSVGANLLGLGHAVEDLKKKPTKKSAKEMGEKLAEEMMEMHGSGMLDTFARGLTQFHARRAGMAGRGMAEDQALAQEDMEGAGWLSDFASGFKKGFLGVMKPGLAIASVLPGPAGIAGKIGTIGLNTLGFGRSGGNASSSGAYQGEGKRRVIKRRGPLAADDPRRKRAEIVKRVMREKGLKMIQASKYVKDHGLY